MLDMDTYLRLSVLNSLQSLFPQSKAFWSEQIVAKWTLQGIVNEFQSQCKKILFVVVDEVDLVCNYPINIGYGLTPAHARRYYDLWETLDAVIRNLGTTFCCCGKSSMLFAIGRHMYAEHGCISPGKVRYIILDTFRLEDIIGYVVHQLGELAGG